MRSSMAFLVAALFATPLIAAAAEPSDAAKSARAWLALVDQGHFGASWTASGSIFRDHIDKPRWAHMVAQVRTPLGKVVFRNLVNEEQSSEMQGAPDGAYDTIRFSTVFAHRQSAVETVVMAQEPDGWRVDGYFVK